MMMMMISNQWAKNTFIQKVSVYERTRKGIILQYFKEVNLKCNSKFDWTEFNMRINFFIPYGLFGGDFLFSSW